MPFIRRFFVFTEGDTLADKVFKVIMPAALLALVTLFALMTVALTS